MNTDDLSGWSHLQLLDEMHRLMDLEPPADTVYTYYGPEEDYYPGLDIQCRPCGENTKVMMAFARAFERDIRDHVVDGECHAAMVWSFPLNDSIYGDWIRLLDKPTAQVLRDCKTILREQASETYRELRYPGRLARLPELIYQAKTREGA